MTKFKVFVLMLGVQILHGCIYGIMAVWDSKYTSVPILAIIVGLPFAYGIFTAFLMIRSAFKQHADYSVEREFTMK